MKKENKQLKYTLILIAGILVGIVLSNLLR